MRLFVALDLAEDVRQELEGLIAKLKKDCPGARWVRPEGIHVTVKFIGYIEDGKLDSVIGALAAVHLEQPVDMEFRGLGFFPNEHRPRVVWCGVNASPNLAELAAAIEGALEPLGIVRESRKFVPHLTLARIEPGKGFHGQIQKLVQAASELAETQFGEAHDAEFHLYESVLKRSGAEYTRLQAFRFVKGSA